MSRHKAYVYILGYSLWKTPFAACQSESCVFRRVLFWFMNAAGKKTKLQTVNLASFSPARYR